MKKIINALAIIEKQNAKPLRQRFDEKFQARDKKLCWIWDGAKNMKGYGYVMIDKTLILAHRLSYFFHKGHIPHGLCICHECDTPACINPYHLFLGTKKDNAIDAFRKGRLFITVGELHATSKLTNRDVLEIRKLGASGQSGDSLSRAFNVTKSTIGSILKRKTWRHI